jgi:hypothetical protein
MFLGLIFYFDNSQKLPEEKRQGYCYDKEKKKNRDGRKYPFAHNPSPYTWCLTSSINRP